MQNYARPVSDMPWFRPWMLNSTKELKRDLIKYEGREWRCDGCELNEWMGQRIPLQIDHIDGVRNNCLRTNLRFLCPNCHAMTPTYAGRNRKNGRLVANDDDIRTAYDKFLIQSGRAPSLNELHMSLGYSGPIRNDPQRDRLIRALGVDRPTLRMAPAPSASPKHDTKIVWPDDHVIEELLVTYPRTAVAEMLGVSDTAVKKHCAKRNIPESGSYRRRPTAPTAALVNSREPSTMSRRDRSLARLKAAHGTRKGYLLESRLGVPHCPKCRTANTKYCAQLRLRTAG